jgi:glycosyltransferase involved in cell wall biosynthesis
VLFLTDNPNLVSSARVLRGWLTAGRGDGLDSYVAVQRAGDLSRWLESNGFPCRISSMPWPDWRRPAQSLWYAWKLARWVRRERIDVVHCNEHGVFPFGSLVARLALRPVVCSVRCRIDAGFGGWAFGKHEPAALTWSTPQMQRECAAALNGSVRPERQHIVAEGVDPNEFRPADDLRPVYRARWGLADGDLVVGMASALRPGKRIEDFLELATRLHALGKPVSFALAGGLIPGEDRYQSRLLPMIEAAKARLPFRWLGHVEPVEPFLQALDIAVSTSAHESFGMSVCEALACGLPVAAYRACSVEEVVGDAGLLVETGDLDGLTAAAARLIDQPQLRAQLGQRGRQRVLERFNPTATLRQLKQVYAAAVG